VSPRADLECRVNYSDVLLSFLLSDNVGVEILTAVTRNSLVAVQRHSVGTNCTRLWARRISFFVLEDGVSMFFRSAYSYLLD
jgi:hypothetical protein